MKLRSLNLIRFFEVDQTGVFSGGHLAGRNLEETLISGGSLFTRNLISQKRQINDTDVNARLSKVTREPLFDSEFNLPDLLGKFDKLIDETHIGCSGLYSEIKKFSERWLILEDKFSYDIASSGIKIFIKEEFYSKVEDNMSKFPVNSVLSSNQKSIFHDQISELLTKNIVSIADHSQVLFQSSIFFVLSETRTTKIRLIFNMKKLNKCLKWESFTMTTVPKILHFIEKDSYVCSLDISQAYYHVPIHEDYKKYFSFVCDGIRYMFNVMPFGLCSAPYLFTKFTSSIWKFLRKHYCMKIFVYLDDILIIAESFDLAKLQMSRTVNILTYLGFKINMKKSELIPSQKFVFLGVSFDTTNMSMCNSELNISKCLEKTKFLLNKSTVSKYELTSLLGLLNFMVDYANDERTYLYPLIKYINCNFPCNDNRNLQKPKIARFNEIIQRWSNSACFLPTPIHPKVPTVTLRTDASKRKWGATLENNTGLNHCSGPWEGQAMCLNINNKELLTILNSLKTFENLLQTDHVSIFTDNKTAVSVLKKKGTHKDAFRHNTVREILELLAKSRSTFEVHHIPGVKNVLADFLSRKDHIIPSELQLSKNLFLRICEKFGVQPQIDLFATHFSRKCTVFTSSIPHPEALGLNAFTLNWASYNVLYAFPPPSLIGRVLYKWRTENNGKLLLVAPEWPSQVWYPLLQQLKKMVWKLEMNSQEVYLQTMTGRRYLDAGKYHLTAYLL